LESPAERASLGLTTERITEALGTAARRWREPNFPPRRALVPRIAERTGYCEQAVEYALDRLFETLTANDLRATIAGELGTLAALDGFVRRPRRPDGWARGVERVVIVSSDTTIGVAIPAAAFALCARAQVIVKDRADGLVAAFAASLAEIEPALGPALQARRWNGHDDPAALASLAAADVVVAYGRDEALRAIRAQLAPQARFVPYGHRTSIGFIPAAALADVATARAHARSAALDAVLYEGEGCLSLHALFVERGGSVEPDAFAALVSESASDLAKQFPPPEKPEPAISVHYRKRLGFREANGAGRVRFAGGTVVAFDPPREEAPPLQARTLGIYPVDSPDEVVAYVRAQRLPLEALATPGGATPHAVLALARALGIARIAALGRLQAPPLGGEHGGSGRILPFVRWIYRDR
jgi:hypothetical protein